MNNPALKYIVLFVFLICLRVKSNAQVPYSDFEYQQRKENCIPAGNWYNTDLIDSTAINCTVHLPAQVDREDLEISIYNVLGNLVGGRRSASNSHKINFKHLANGIYMIIFKSENAIEKQKLSIHR